MSLENKCLFFWLLQKNKKVAGLSYFGGFTPMILVIWCTLALYIYPRSLNREEWFKVQRLNLKPENSTLKT